MISIIIIGFQAATILILWISILIVILFTFSTIDRYQRCLLYFVYKPMSFIDLCLMFLLGVFALIGQLCILTGYRNAPAAVVAPMQYSQIIWAIIFGTLFFNESVDTLTLVGAAITITAGILMVWRESRVSVHQPVLRSRNMRSVGSAPLPGFESEN